MKETFILRNSAYLAVIAFISAFFSIFTSPAYAALCAKWSAGEKIGELNHLRIDEASGIAVSSKFPGRLYHVNDSGGGPYFYITDTDGKNTRSVHIEGFNARRSDFEDMALGPCSGDKSCIFIADIGDNGEKRKFIEIIVVTEVSEFKDSVKPLERLRLTYPDRPHNAEGLAVHPNGDIYILTKEEDLDKSIAHPAKLYKLEKERWESAGDKELKLDYTGEIDFSQLSLSDSVFGKLPTALDISPDGRRFLVLTYENAYEFNVDLSQDTLKPAEEMKKGKDYSTIEIPALPQQESVSYTDAGRAFIYDTEYKVLGAPIMKVECLDEDVEKGVNGSETQ